MWQKLYKRFIAPRQGDEDTRNREYVLNVLLVGTLIITVAALLVLVNSYVAGNTYVAPRILSVLLMLAAVGGMYRLSRVGKFKVAAYGLVLLYALITFGVGVAWGIVMPISVLLLGLIIILASILLGARYALFAAGAVLLAIVLMKLAETNGVIQPDWSWVEEPSNAGTLTGIALVFIIMAVVSWLFNYKMEQSLHRAKRAEAALQRQKRLLESTVEKRTRELQAAQLEKVQQLYRFAELGQLSTALLHDLSNHLTTLTLDIEGLEAQNRSRMLQRAKRSMRYIDDMVARVRDQLHGKSRPHVFNVTSETEAVVKILQHKAGQANVTLVWEQGNSRRVLKCRGDSVRFRQLIANLISNAIDAYETGDALDRRQVRISAGMKAGTIRLVIEDWGKGIQLEERAKLFEPFYSTKKSGMGLGLFVAKQIAEEQFGGTIKIDNNQTHTVFVVTLKAHA